MLNTEKIPSQLKIIKVILLNKANNETHLSNDRPIASLPFISKIIENVILNQVSITLSITTYYQCKQYLFRAKRSNESGALILVDHLNYKFAYGEIPLNV